MGIWVYQTEAGRHRFDIEKLGKKPLLQSIYAEALRLRIAAFIIRSPEREDMRIKEWTLPEGEIVLVAKPPAHMDEKVWNTGPTNEHPLHTFWADRFIIYPGDPTSGPRRRKIQQKIPQIQKGDVPKLSLDEFSLDDLNGSWIPYGEGFRACPGRQFAKPEILMTFAIMVTMFDIEFDRSKALRTDPRANGLGAQHPKDQIPFRIRKRQTQYKF